jgi:hypothetical protein
MEGHLSKYVDVSKQPFVNRCNTDICASCVDAWILRVQQGTEIGGFVRSLGRIPTPSGSHLHEWRNGGDFGGYLKVLGNCRMLAI